MRRRQPKRPDEFCRLTSTGSPSQGWLPHRAQSLSMVEGRAVASALVFRALLPPHPALSLGERENRTPRLRQSRAAGLVAARDAVFPLPGGEGKGEGE